MLTQTRVDGAISGGRANKANKHEESLEAKANYFINLMKSKIWPIIFIALSTKKWPMYHWSSPLDNFGPEECSLARKLCQRIGGHMLTTKIGRNWSDRYVQAVWPVDAYVAGLARPTGLTGGSDRSKQSLSTTRIFYRFKSFNRISYRASPPTL